jgi:hypothetical protein
MKNAVNDTQHYQMLKSEFEKYGNRQNSDYVFNLEIVNGKVANNVSGSAVARDLFDILKKGKESNELLTKNNYKINMGKSFILEISLL